MIYKILLIIALSWIHNPGVCQNTKALKSLTGNIRSDISTLLKPGTYKVDVMDGVEDDPRASELTIKMFMGIKNNYAWYIEYLKSLTHGNPVPYHSNFEMSEDEYNELQMRIKNLRLYSTSREKVKVIHDNNTISFKTSVNLEILESVSIDLVTTIITINDYVLSFSDTIHVSSDENPLRAAWKGYTWIFSDPDPFDFDLLKDIPRLNAKLYSVSIGLIEGSNRVYLSIKGRETIDGKGVIEFEYPLIFNL